MISRNAGAVLLALALSPAAMAAELRVGDLTITPGSTAMLVVSGSVCGEATGGVTILVQLVPHPGAVGTVSFTDAPPVDVVQFGDAWPWTGKFLRFDTDVSMDPSLNGSADDSAVALGAVGFPLGPLSGFPIVASEGASGVWDALLLPGSRWNDGHDPPLFPTEFFHGLVTVAADVCTVDEDCVGNPNPCVTTSCNTAMGVCEEQFVVGLCDDGDDCTVDDACDGNGSCVGTPIPPIPDCNGNGIADACEVPPQCIDCRDCNANGQPDECEPDADGDGTPDACDAGGVWFVDDDGPNDPSPGDPSVSDPLEDGSLDHPFDAIQEGLDASASGDVVVVHAGTYVGVGNRNMDFGGRSVALECDRSGGACLIDCERMGRAFVFQNAETAGSVIDGFTVVRGLADVGGAVLVAGASPTIRNCAFIAHTADDGGAMFVDGGASTISNCTFTANVGTCGAGGISNQPGGQATVSNCILWENLGGSVLGSTDIAISYCAVQGPIGGVMNIEADPAFVRSPSAGADGEWGTDDDDFGDLRLMAESPAIDAGDPDVAFTPGNVDLDGHARVLCTRVDIGAYESGLGDFECDGDVDVFDFAAWEATCVTGPAGGPFAPGCESFDADGDHDVDFADFRAFQGVAGGTP